MVIWDWVPTLGLNEDEQSEEVQTSPINVTTRSKVPVGDQSLVLLKVRNIKETFEKIIITTQTQQKVNSKGMKETNPTINKPVETLANKIETTKEQDMGYDIVGDIKKTKSNISLFELCNFPQQRRKLLEAFDPHPNSILEAIEYDDEVNEARIGGISKSQTFPFLLSFKIFNHNVHNLLVDSGASSIVVPL